MKEQRTETRSVQPILTLTSASALVQRREVSPVELTQACLRKVQELNPELNAFITVTDQSALEQAHRAEDEIRNGKWRGPLHGIPIALKDLIDTAGVRTTAASALFENRVPEKDAEVVRRLKEAGAVLVGKTNLHEFAYGGSSIISRFGAVRNPRATDRIAGGSSGGSAVAVAAGMCFGAIGTDTAGSIREPAALCGVVGLKPSYGLVSTRGIIPLAWSYDHVGPISRSVSDAALILQAIAGFDAADINSRELPLVDYKAALGSSIKGLRIGVPREVFLEGLDREVDAAFSDALQMLGTITADQREVSVPLEKDRTVANCESYVYHARYLAKSPDLYHPSTLARILAGEKVTAIQYIEGKQKLETTRRAVLDLFTAVDVLVTPTTPVPA
ncbi:MAG TPA: amidase, partial [Terriglobales bacterium]|nr:amidase [Terriglobales bacterium]